MNEEFLVSTSHQLVLITSLPFVHTARRLNRLDDPVNDSDWKYVGNNTFLESLVNQII
jgi:hypothetical protein